MDEKRRRAAVDKRVKRDDESNTGNTNSKRVCNTNRERVIRDADDDSTNAQNKGEASNTNRKRVIRDADDDSTNAQNEGEASIGRDPDEAFLAFITSEKDMEYYVNAAFRSMRDNEVFIFLQFDYLVIKYDPETPGNDCLVKGPLLLCDGFPSLYSSSFQDPGVDAAFGCHGVNEAFLFSLRWCVKISYDLDTLTGDITLKAKGKSLTSDMFPCLVGVLEDVVVDAAFESMVVGEAYLFRGSRYAILNYSKGKVVASGLITDAFPCLRDTIFSSGIGAAFASHKSNQVYLFKDKSYWLVHYNPRQPNDSYIIHGPRDIVPDNWPSLRGIVPHNCCGRGDIEPKTWKAAWGHGGRWYRVNDDYELIDDDYEENPSAVETGLYMSDSDINSSK